MLRSLLFVAIALVVLTLLSTLAAYINFRRNTRKLRHIALTREGIDSPSRLLAEFPHVPQDILRDIHKDLQFMTGVSDFPLLPDDKVYDDLLIDEDDLAGIVQEIVRKHGGNFELATEKLPADAVQTVRDVVNWIDKAIHIEDVKNGPNL